MLLRYEKNILFVPLFFFCKFILSVLIGTQEITTHLRSIPVSLCKSWVTYPSPTDGARPVVESRFRHRTTSAETHKHTTTHVHCTRVLTRVLDHTHVHTHVRTSGHRQSPLYRSSHTEGQSGPRPYRPSHVSRDKRVSPSPKDGLRGVGMTVAGWSVVSFRSQSTRLPAACKVVPGRKGGVRKVAEGAEGGPRTSVDLLGWRVGSFQTPQFQCDRG